MPLKALAAVVSLCALFTWNGAAADPTAPGRPAPHVPRDSAGRSLVWADEFGGKSGTLPAASRWTLATGGGGWGNGELQCYTGSRQNSAVNGKGQLVITAARHLGRYACADGNRNLFSSARLTTQNKFTVTHGRLEIRAKLPSGAGAWPAFWAIGAVQPKVGWPVCGEIDVMEYTGNRPTVTTSAAHLARNDGKHWYSMRGSPPSTTLSSAFHVYGVEWTSSSLTFYRDATVTGTITRKEVAKHGSWPFDKPFYLLLNLAMGGTYAGKVPATLLAPQRFVIDYVRVYH